MTAHPRCSVVAVGPGAHNPKKSTPKTVLSFRRSGKARAMNKQTLAAYVLRALAEAQIEGRVSTLATLTSDIQVRKVDIRGVVTSLHREGYLDVLRMRLTLRGFAVGRALMEERLRELRPKPVAVSAA